MSFRLIGIGEVLWDLLPAGPQLGGAPANFACHARMLGAEAMLVSRIGSDELGREATNCLTAIGLPTETIEVDGTLPTGTVSVTLETDGQPRFTIREPVAWDAIAGSPTARRASEGADAICFGTLAQRSEPSRSTIRALVSACLEPALRVLDINLRQPYFSRDLIEESLGSANILKVNDAELAQLAEMFRLTGEERSQLSQLAGRFDLRLVAYTRGARGSLLLSNGRWSEHVGVRTKVVDTVGAGDAFTAALTIGLLAGWALDEINQRANEIAAFVCSQPGATPKLPSELCAPFQAVKPVQRRAGGE
jgi:fructokinase